MDAHGRQHAILEAPIRTGLLLQHEFDVDRRYDPGRFADGRRLVDQRRECDRRRTGGDLDEGRAIDGLLRHERPRPAESDAHESHHLADRRPHRRRSVEYDLDVGWRRPDQLHPDGTGAVHAEVRPSTRDIQSAHLGDERHRGWRHRHERYLRVRLHRAELGLHGHVGRLRSALVGRPLRLSKHSPPGRRPIPSDARAREHARPLGHRVGVLRHGGSAVRRRCVPVPRLHDRSTASRGVELEQHRPIQ